MSSSRTYLEMWAHLFICQPQPCSWIVWFPVWGNPARQRLVCFTETMGTLLVSGRAGVWTQGPTSKDMLFPVPLNSLLCGRLSALHFSNTATSLVDPCRGKLVTRAPIQPPIQLWTYPLASESKPRVSSPGTQVAGKAWTTAASSGRLGTDTVPKVSSLPQIPQQWFHRAKLQPDQGQQVGIKTLKPIRSAFRHLIPKPKLPRGPMF